MEFYLALMQDVVLVLNLEQIGLLANYLEDEGIEFDTLRQQYQQKGLVATWMA